jgi:hypothetical protein
MTSAGILALLARRGPRPICDACLADHLGLAVRSIAASARRLAMRELRRFDGHCSGCCTMRRVTAPAAH